MVIPLPREALEGEDGAGRLEGGSWMMGEVVHVGGFVHFVSTQGHMYHRCPA